MVACVFGVMLIAFCLFLKFTEAEQAIVEPKEESRELSGCMYPPDPFTKIQRQRGGVVLHVIGMFYMFLAIMIACDEFFVPALEILVDRLELEPEIAGATFMAAGGSTPELFTALFGSLAESSVGFGTIVGSAVFNILFVIGMCAIYSLKPLQLTKWPFFRDSVYYIFALLTLGMFFSVATPNTIHHYEAGLLLLMYFGYCMVMVHNSELKNILGFNIQREKDVTEMKAATKLLTMMSPECSVKGPFDGPDMIAKVHVKGTSLFSHDECVDIKVHFKKWMDRTTHITIRQEFPGYAESFFDTNEVQIFVISHTCDDEECERQMEILEPTINDHKKWKKILGLSIKLEIIDVEMQKNEEANKIEFKHHFQAFSSGMMTTFRNGRTAGIEATIFDMVKGDARKLFEQFDADRDGEISFKEFCACIFYLTEEDNPRAVDADVAELQKAFEKIDTDDSGGIDAGEFVHWYIDHCEQTKNAYHEILNKYHGFYLDAMQMTEEDFQSEVEKSDAFIHIPMTEEQFTDLANNLWHPEDYESWRKQLTGYRAGFPTYDSYNKWCRSQVDFSFLKDGEEVSIFETIIELICMPIMMMMNILPSVEEEDSAPETAWDRNKYMITFVGSIGFIGFFSYFMVWWAEIIGCTIGIPSTIMGLTFLAGGTSVPDLITSVIVAKQGNGDMAVSSSIGSNIFDVLVGLPFGWLCFAIINGRPNKVMGAGEVIVSLAVLIGMIAVVLLVIMYSQWIMNKMLGWSMFVFYVIFLIQAVLSQEIGTVLCPCE